jgi:outer membrane protein
MRRTGKFAGVFALGLSFLTGTVAGAENLGSALISAYKHSGLLEQNRALLRAADEDVAATAAALRPVVRYSLGANYSSVTQDVSTNLGITANLTLYDNGNAALRREVAKENVLSLREALRTIESNVLLNAVTAYTNVRRDNSIVRLRDNNLKVVQRELQASRDRFEVGEITRTEVAIAEARVASAQSDLAIARGNLDRSREQYRNAVGEYPSSLDTPPTPPSVPSSQAEAQAIARTVHPDMKQAQHNVNIAELNVQLAEKSLLPVLSGSASLNVDQDGNDTSSIGINLAGPIYNGGALASSIRQANARRDASRAVLHLTRHALDQSVGIAWSQLEVSSAALRATDEQIKAFRVAYEGVREEAELGARTSLDVLNAEQDVFDAEAAKLSAESDRYVGLYSLLAATGQLSVRHLGLNVATYDPAAYYEAVKNAPTTLVSPQGEQLDRVLSVLGKK